MICTMTPNEIEQFRNYMRKCISMNFTLEEKECIIKKKKEIKEAGEARGRLGILK